MRRLLERALLLIGIVSAGWFVGSVTASRLDQAAGSRDLEREIAAARSRRRRPASRVPPVAADGSIIGELSIPRLGLSAIAREGTGSSTLRVAIGHIPGTALPPASGNAGFAAHRDSFFHDLGRLRPNDEVRLRRPSGTFVYRVQWTLIAEPEATWVIGPASEESLTLVTCYPFHYVGPAPKRFVVRATLFERPT
jgi:sortase A